MDENLIIHEYVDNRKTLRAIAKNFNTNHQKIKRVLERNGVEITQKNRVRELLTKEHKEKLSLSAKGRECFWKNKKMQKTTLYKNMMNHLQWDVDLEFLTQFQDIEKLKTLNKMLSRERVSAHFNTEKYKAFIEKFYYDEQFNKVYLKYNEKKENYLKPSLDHIIPVSKGGSWNLDNLQILHWCINRAKYNYSKEEWQSIINIIKEEF